MSIYVVYSLVFFFVFIPIRCYGEIESRVLWRLQPPADE